MPLLFEPASVESASPSLSTGRILAEGGDERITLDPLTLTNKYGCRPIPDTEIAAFGSATASTISPAGFAAAEALRNRLMSASQAGRHADTYRAETDRIRTEIVALCGLEELRGLEVILSPSGTELHMLAARLVAEGGSAKTLVIMVQSTETGSGVGDALAGHMHPRYAVDGRSGASLIDGLDVVAVPIRADDGSARPAGAIDSDVEAIVATASSRYQRVLIVLSDVSKTGLVAPSPRHTLDLKKRWPDLIEVLVDAAQFRLAPRSLQGYLAAGCMVAVTGSKFVGGPIFSAALLVPGPTASRLAKSPLDPALHVTCARGEWPERWNGAIVLREACNYGLLLRWEAALAELRAFRAIPEADVERVVRAFRDAVASRLDVDPHFESLEQPDPDRRAIVATAHWDQVPTIFPFVLSRASSGRTPLTAAATREIYSQMRSGIASTSATSKGSAGPLSLRCELGQPVVCGERHGVQLAALRLCLSARLIVGAVSEGRRGHERLLDQAHRVLDKAAYLVDSMRDT